MSDQHLPATTTAADERPVAQVTPLREPETVLPSCSCELPSVQVALARAIAEVQAVGKDGQMSQDAGGYRYRRVDDLVDACSDALARHGVVVVPDVVERTRSRVGSETHVDVHMQFKIIGPRGDWFDLNGYGEAMDRRDRATAKAGTDAWKFTLLRLLLVRVSDRNDSEPRNADPRQPTGDPLAQPLVRVAVHAARLAGRGLITGDMEREAIAYASKGEAHCGQIVDRLHQIEAEADDPGEPDDDDQGDDDAGDGPDGQPPPGPPEGGAGESVGSTPDPATGEPAGEGGAPTAAAAVSQSPHPSAGDQVNPGPDGRADRFYRERGSLLEPAAETVARRTGPASQPDAPAGPAADRPAPSVPRGPVDSDGFTDDERSALHAARITARQLSDLAHVVTVGMTSAVRTVSASERAQLMRIVERIAAGDLVLASRRLRTSDGAEVDPWTLEPV